MEAKMKSKNSFNKQAEKYDTVIIANTHECYPFVLNAIQAMFCCCLRLLC